MTFTAVMAGMPQWPGTILVGSRRVVLWDPDNEIYQGGIMTINAGTRVITLTMDEPWPEGGGEWILPPWQENVRGPNGEWLASTMIIITGT